MVQHSGIAKGLDLPPRPQRLQLRKGVWHHRVAVPRHLRAVLGKFEFTRSLHTGDLAKARRLAAIEDAKAQATLDRAQRQFEAHRAQIVDLSEAEAWSLATKWLIDAEKCVPVDMTPRELIQEAEDILFGIVSSDPGNLRVRAEALNLLREYGIGELTPESTNRLLGFVQQAIVENAKRLMRHSNHMVALNPRFTGEIPGKLPSITFRLCRGNSLALRRERRPFSRSKTKLDRIR
jgi:hypothetical protein